MNDDNPRGLEAIGCGAHEFGSCKVVCGSMSAYGKTPDYHYYVVLPVSPEVSRQTDDVLLHILEYLGREDFIGPGEMAFPVDADVIRRLGFEVAQADRREEFLLREKHHSRRTPKK